LRFVTFPHSTTTANLMRDGRLTVALALDEGIWDMRFKARRLAHTSADVPLAFFEAELESARLHRAPYAAVRAKRRVRRKARQTRTIHFRGPATRLTVRRDSSLLPRETVEFGRRA
jgi:hypothetical protein